MAYNLLIDIQALHRTSFRQQFGAFFSNNAARQAVATDKRCTQPESSASALPTSLKMPSHVLSPHQYDYLDLLFYVFKVICFLFNSCSLMSSLVIMLRSVPLG